MMAMPRPLDAMLREDSLQSSFDDAECALLGLTCEAVGIAPATADKQLLAHSGSQDSVDYEEEDVEGTWRKSATEAFNYGVSTPVLTSAGPGPGKDLSMFEAAPWESPDFGMQFGLSVQAEPLPLTAALAPLDSSAEAAHQHAQHSELLHPAGDSRVSLPAASPVDWSRQPDGRQLQVPDLSERSQSLLVQGSPDQGSALRQRNMLSHSLSDSSWFLGRVQQSFPQQQQEPFSPPPTASLAPLSSSYGLPSTPIQYSSSQLSLSSQLSSHSLQRLSSLPFPARSASLSPQSSFERLDPTYLLPLLPESASLSSSASHMQQQPALCSTPLTFQPHQSCLLQVPSAPPTPLHSSNPASSAYLLPLHPHHSGYTSHLGAQVTTHHAAAPRQRSGHPRSKRARKHSDSATSDSAKPPRTPPQYAPRRAVAAGQLLVIEAPSSRGQLCGVQQAPKRSREDAAAAAAAGAGMAAGRKLAGKRKRPVVLPAALADTNAEQGRKRKHHNPWSMEETVALVEGVQECGGGKWADIKKLDNPAIKARSAVDLKDKWRNLQRIAALSPAAAAAKADKRPSLPADLLARVRQLAACVASKGRDATRYTTARTSAKYRQRA